MKHSQLLAVRQAWQPGDVMLVDNVLTTHGRDPIRGDRKVVVAIGDPIHLEDCQPTVAGSAEIEDVA
jgi:hypothetical protein